MNTPEHASDSQIARLLEAPITNHEKIAELTTSLRDAKALNPETLLGNRPYNLAQHVFDTAAAMNRVLVERRKESTADWLYRRFKPGSAILTKLEAYRIAGELDTQAVELAEARATIQRLLAEIAELAVHAPRVGRTMSNGPFEPADVVDVREPDDVDGDDEVVR